MIDVPSGHVSDGLPYCYGGFWVAFKKTTRALTEPSE
jgi:hypothetical protein